MGKATSRLHFRALRIIVMHSTDCRQPSSFVHQYDEELDDLKKARRPGRPASTREDLLKVKINVLEKEYESGFCEYYPSCAHPSCFFASNHVACVTNGNSVTPETTTEEDALRLERWEGSWAYLTGIKWVRITGNATQPSSFPPRGS